MLKILLQSATVLTLSATLSFAATARPNILFIVGDGMRADAIHALGNDCIQTPNIDRLVKRGATFTQMYNMGSTVPEVGASTRAVMLSGRSLFRFSGDVSDSLDDMPLLPGTLRHAGYSTFATGMWQNGHRWFKQSFSQGDEICFGPRGENADPALFDFDESGEYAEANGHRPGNDFNETFAAAATSFLKNRPRGKPFFAYVSFSAPCDLQCVPSKYRSMYASNQPPLPQNVLRKHPFDIGGTDRRTDESAPSFQARNEIRQRLADYYGMITHLDAQVGVVLDALEDAGVSDNTIVVFTSDSGLAMGSHGLMADQNLYEHSIRVPLILSGPGIPRDKQYITLSYQMDVYPTLCEMISLKVPDSVEGKSLLPVLRVKAGEIRSTVFAAYLDQQRAVRDYRWKLIYYPQINRYQLFNLRNDPDEQNDLFPSGDHGRDINRLRIQLDAWQSSLDDPLR